MSKIISAKLNSQYKISFTGWYLFIVLLVLAKVSAQWIRVLATRPMVYYNKRNFLNEGENI